MFVSHSSFEIQDLEPINQSLKDLTKSKNIAPVNLKDRIFQEQTNPEFEALMESLPSVDKETDEIWSFDSVLARLSQKYPSLSNTMKE